MRQSPRRSPARVRPHLRVEERDPNILRPYAANARKHSPRQIQQLTASISCFGFVVPALINANDEIIAGHARIEAAKVLGLDRVPCIRVEHLSNAQERTYRLADNRLAELAAWDSDLLAKELEVLTDLDLDFSIEVTGFDTAEIDLIIEKGASQRPDPADDVPSLVVDRPAVTQLEDLWQLGAHRLFCGDARDARSFERLLGGEKAQIVFADPPYNVPIHGHASGLGRTRHREFAMAGGEMPPTEYLHFLETICANLVVFTIDGSMHFICMDWRHAKALLTAGERVYSELKNICVWNKDNGGMGSLYRSKHELVFVWKAGTAPHINNIELGRSGRYRTNVWDYAGIRHFRDGREDELAMHPTVKPVALVADAIRDCSRRGSIVLDPFAGSGTTLIAADKTGRRAAAIELDPLYVDTAIRRWQAFTGKAAIHTETGVTFAEAERSSSPVVKASSEKHDGGAREADHA
jgi:DNA modification methylase